MRSIKEELKELQDTCNTAIAENMTRITTNSSRLDLITEAVIAELEPSEVEDVPLEEHLLGNDITTSFNLVKTFFNRLTGVQSAAETDDEDEDEDVFHTPCPSPQHTD